MSLGVFSFLEEFEKYGNDSSVNVWYNSPVKPSGSGLFFVEMFLIIDSIFLLVCSDFLFHHDSVWWLYVFSNF